MLPRKICRCCYSHLGSLFTVSSLTFASITFPYASVNLLLLSSPPSLDFLRDQAHFNDVRMVCNYALKLQVQVSKEKKITVKETKGPYAQYRLRLVPGLSSAHPTPSILYNELVEEPQSKLDKSVKNNNTGYLGGVEVRIITRTIYFRLFAPIKD